MRFIPSAAAALLLAGSATVFPAAATAPALTTAPLPESIPSDLPRIARPTHYSISFVPDAQNLTFAGTESVDLELFEASDVLTLHAHELAITSARISPAGGSGEAIALTPSLDEDSQTVRLRADRPLAPGAYRLELAYTGKINTQANGLFALDYPDKRTGEEVRGLFTQFEAPDGRRFAPMFDEPSYKATFDLTATVPSTQMAVSNMPVASEQDLGNGTKRVTFATSPRMSSYLLFFALGDFERLSKQAADGVEVGIVAPAGSGEQGRYALESLAPLVGYFNDYFGVEYPLPKLDNIAGPGRSQFFGAMENWGAIFTFESILLEDPAISSAATRQRIYSVQAHETAHQWFGNIVTMAWWDDLWLNEGFASWMETKTTDHFNPTWHALLGRVGGREAAMNLDSLVTTHPVVQRIRTVEETNQAFDAIAYQKGEAVISMLEAYAGEDVWREGLRRYMERHKFQNTVSDDLWRAVEEAGATGLTAIAHDFTRQPGIPLLNASARCEGGETLLSLTQSEFSRDRKDEVAANPQRWRVPVLAAVVGGEARRHVLEGSGQLSLSGCGPVVVNSGQLGYYRTLYTPEMLGQLEGAMARLQPIDQLGLMRDNLSLARAGYQPMSPALDLLAAIPRDANPVVAASAVDQWRAVHSVTEDQTDQAALAKVMQDLWLPRLEALGYEPRAGEELADANLRSELISTLGAMRDERVLAEARQRFARLADDPRALDGPLKTTWLAIAANNASAEDWALLADLAAKSTSTVEKGSYYQQLGAVADEALAQKALDLALSGEAGLTNSAAIISSVAWQHPELAYDFVMANRARVEELVDDSGRARFFTGLAATSTDPAMIERLESLHASLPEDQRQPVERALASLQDRLASYPRLRTEIHEWLAPR
jgi:aminopeptidase N